MRLIDRSRHAYQIVWGWLTDPAVLVYRREARGKDRWRVRTVEFFLFVRYYETGGRTEWIGRPSGVEGWGRPFHDILIPIMGTPLVDNGDYEALAKEAAARRRWEFMVSWGFMRIPGGTATPFTAIATF